MNITITTLGDLKIVEDGESSPIYILRFNGLNPQAPQEKMFFIRFESLATMLVKLNKKGTLKLRICNCIGAHKIENGLMTEIWAFETEEERDNCFENISTNIIFQFEDKFHNEIEYANELSCIII